MGKILKFERPNRADTPSKPELSPVEAQACDIAKFIRSTITDKQLERIKRELDAESDDKEP